jgi:hypothetical protein
LPDRFIYIEVLDGAIQKKQKNGQTTKTELKKQLEKPVENRLKTG